MSRAQIRSHCWQILHPKAAPVVGPGTVTVTNQYFSSSSGAASFERVVGQFPTTTEAAATTAIRKRLDVAIVGAPNAGKSQLLNVLTQSSVAAVSRKRHTTRGGILGARTMHDSDTTTPGTGSTVTPRTSTQLVFWDTPGYLQAESARKEGLDGDLMLSATAEMVNVDYSLLVVDAARLLVDSYRNSIHTLMTHALQSQGREEAVIEVDYKPDKPLEAFSIVLNKVDHVHPKDRLLELADDLGNMAESCISTYLENKTKDQPTNELPQLEHLFPTIFYTNALKAEGTDDILTHLQTLATPCLEWPVEAGHTTIMTPLERVEENIREKVYRTLHQEIPHSVRQVNREFVQRPGGIVEIHQDLVVKSKSHYTIIAGRSLALIQQAAQRDLEKSVFKDMKVLLRLHLKLNKGQHDRHSRANMEGTVQFYRRSR